MTIKIEQERIKKLVKKTAEGDCDSFGELERLARPLLVHYATYFSGLHYKFEYEDFYSICLRALYEACLQYNPKNPSFLSYAKRFMTNQCNRELEYWNMEMRNIFKVKEIMVGLEREIDTNENRLIQLATVEDKAFSDEFRNNVNLIIDSMFDNDKAEVLRLHIFYDMRPRDIADYRNSEYHKTYSIIRRGVPKIAEEYKNRFTLDLPISL
jgi:RNA polymerase sigma factor (sigma-70 family)